jgi:hypothetical protein
MDKGLHCVVCLGGGCHNLPLVLAFPALVALAVDRLGLCCLKVKEQVGVFEPGGGGGRGRKQMDRIKATRGKSGGLKM